jgi:hypothetical protein
MINNSTSVPDPAGHQSSGNRDPTFVFTTEASFTSRRNTGTLAVLNNAGSAPSLTCTVRSICEAASKSYAG